LVQQLDLPSGTKKPLIFVSETGPSASLPNYEKSTKLDNNLQKSMDVLVGDIRILGSKLCYKVASDNTVRGAAGNSILLAEMLLAQGIIHDSRNILKSNQRIR
jgi:aspartate-semialdehyde dehydrogenase